MNGAKCDLENQRKVTYEEGKEFANKNNYDDFFETSSKLNINVNETFERMIDLLIQKRKASKDERRLTIRRKRSPHSKTDESEK